ncbi:MAG: putative membrane protein SpoIIM required for sporulation [Rhodothermales bacterium]
MILDLHTFVQREQPYWQELKTAIGYQSDAVQSRRSLEEIQRLHYLYQRAAADLAKMQTYSADPETRAYLSELVARTYAELHGTRSTGLSWREFVAWLKYGIPRAVQHHRKALLVATAAMLIGTAFGGLMVLIEPNAKATLIPGQFQHVLQDPSKRVEQEENAPEVASSGEMTQFSAALMTNNIRVSFRALALGMTYGIGTIVVLFYNGIILGLVGIDFIQAGETTFLLGWLLPHGVIEIPAIVLGGQGGLILAGALIGWSDHRRLRERLKLAAPAVCTLVGAVIIMLIWAGLVEAFFSQLHAPILPYSAKIAFGCIEFAVLLIYLFRPLPPVAE